ncbi:BQ5605_C027g10386 [Microbotryum silenes-dioicae]|uniref:BQ5605_C027g10386 protein n=1 Tax=Microbotryum silenes-dioicae TaxID=796604 RepID=A0A2X0MRZ3_9BASI|nr:BQ5605_C027g10386 [Microbotryum silenes-dioicae]
MKAAPPDTEIPYDGSESQYMLDLVSCLADSAICPVWQSPARNINGHSRGRRVSTERSSAPCPTYSSSASRSGSCNQSTFGHEASKALNRSFSPYTINLWGTFIITSVVYWIGGLIFMAFDLYEPLHNVLKPYKLQPDKRVSVADYKKVCWIVLRNQVLVALPMTWAMATYRPLSTTAPLPGAFETIYTYIFCTLCMEAGFFYVHRLFHHPKLYKHVHKLHHRESVGLMVQESVSHCGTEFTAPVALSSTYCTLPEHLFSNLLPIVLGIMILGAHWSLMIMFFCSLELGTLNTHSGYNFVGGFSALQHDWHHYAYTENFGPTGILDKIYGTNTAFTSWIEELTRRESGQTGSSKGDVVSQARKELARKEDAGETFVSSVL